MLVALKSSAHSDLLAPNGPRVAGTVADTPSQTDSRPPFSLLAENGTRRMSNPHRGLPPLQSLGAHNPPDARQPPPTSLATSSAYQSQPLGQLPEAPRPGQNSDDAMRNWLATKAEEERRKQEEERTKQEGLKLEQRKIEQSMLRDSLQAGIPPPMVPMVFAGMANPDVAKVSLEWAQHYMSQMSLQQPASQQAALPPSQSSADGRQDARTMPGPQSNPYATQPPPALPAPPSSASHALQSQQTNSFGSPYPQQSQNASRFPYQQQHEDSAPAPSRPQAALARLNTGGSLVNMQIQAPPPGGMQMPIQAPPHSHHQGPTSTPQQQPQQHQTPQQQQHQPSPAIYFHHWIPPNTNKDPAPPGSKSTHTSPYASHATSHLRQEYTNSPKKRRTGASGGGSTGDRNSENETSTTSPQDADSPRFEVFRPGDVGNARKRGMSNATRPDSDRQGSAGPGERKRTLSGTPKAELEVNS